MKRLESTASPACFSADDPRISLLRRGRFEGRLAPLQYLVWLGISLSVGLGIAALGTGRIPAEELSRTLQTHFAEAVSFWPVFGQLCLSLLPACLVLTGAGFAYGSVTSVASVLTLAAEGMVSGVCLYVLFYGSHPVPWVAVYALWVLLRLALLTVMAVEARRTSHKRQEFKWLDVNEKERPSPLLQYVKVCLWEWLCGVALCAAVSGLYLLL